MALPVTDEDDKFLALFEKCALPQDEWTHLAHVRVAWICLSLSLFEAALQRIRAGILRYNTDVLRRKHKYHETVTVAFTFIVAHRMRLNERWAVFAGRIEDFVSAETPVLLRYYSSARLFSDEARCNYLEPDLENFPT